MAANQMPRSTCLFSEAVVRRLACSAGTSKAATGQECQQPGLRASWSADPADDGAAESRDDDDAGPRPGLGEDGEAGSRYRAAGPAWSWPIP